MKIVKKIILTGDDFGLSLQVNRAIEQAHQQGALTTASLMVGASAAADAVERARRVPSLRVGLHLVLVDGAPVLPPGAVPDLVDGKGQFSSHLIKSGIGFFFRPKVRRQLEAEVRAQFQAFQKTGLYLDHVNTHHHMHLHPTVSELLLRVGREYGMRAVRLPYEPPLPSWKASKKPLWGRLWAWFLLSQWIALLRRRLRREGIFSNHFVFGMNDSGHLDLNLVLRFLEYLPQGVTEIYFHPSIDSSQETGGFTGDGSRQAELEALTSPLLRDTLESSGIEAIAFSDLR